MEVIEHDVFRRWLSRLKDTRAKMRITARIMQIKRHGSLLGDTKVLGEGLMELRFHFGPGYRVYVSQQGSRLLLLLAGGDKSGQQRDIALARKLLNDWREQYGE